jgi:hypothetical protein
MTKARACKGTGQERGPGVWESVRMNIHTPKWTSIIGSWSPGGLSKLQRVITRVKTHLLVELFISLESYWNLDVQNGLAWPIWTSTTQVMAKRKAGSQTGSLIPNHGKSGINPIPLCVGGVWHAVGKLLTRGYNFGLDFIPIEGLHKKLWSRKVAGLPTLAILGLPNGSPGTKKTIRMPLMWGGVEYIIWGKVVASPNSSGGESCEFEVAHGSS